VEKLVGKFHVEVISWLMHIHLTDVLIIIIIIIILSSSCITMTSLRMID